MGELRSEAAGVGAAVSQSSPGPHPVLTRPSRQAGLGSSEQTRADGRPGPCWTSGSSRLGPRQRVTVAPRTRPLSGWKAPLPSRAGGQAKPAEEAGGPWEGRLSAALTWPGSPQGASGSSSCGARAGLWRPAPGAAVPASACRLCGLGGGCQKGVGFGSSLSRTRGDDTGHSDKG